MGADRVLPAGVQAPAGAVVARAAAFVPDLLFGSHVVSALQAGGHETVLVGAPGQLEAALDIVTAVRARGGIVVATGGCFDLLHAGHIQTLSAARALGDCLIVCLNSDASVRRIKGEPRPLQPQADRAELLSALRDVDAVMIFDEDTPSQLLSQIRPDIWVKGGDYTTDRLPEADLLQQWGGEAVTVGYRSERSTTRLLAQARR